MTLEIYRDHNNKNRCLKDVTIKKEFNVEFNSQK
jgi:hypothetical protein